MRRIKPEESVPSIIHQSQSQGELPRKLEQRSRHFSTAVLKRLISGRKRKSSVDVGGQGTRRLSPGAWVPDTVHSHFLLGGVQTAKSIKPALHDTSPIIPSRKVRVKSKPFLRSSLSQSALPLTQIKQLLLSLGRHFAPRPTPNSKPAALTVLRRHRDFICRVQTETVSPYLMKRVLFSAWKRAYLHP